MIALLYILHISADLMALIPSAPKCLNKANQSNISKNCNGDCSNYKSLMQGNMAKECGGNMENIILELKDQYCNNKLVIPGITVDCKNIKPVINNMPNINKNSTNISPTAAILNESILNRSINDSIFNTPSILDNTNYNPSDYEKKLIDDIIKNVTSELNNSAPPVVKPAIPVVNSATPVVKPTIPIVKPTPIVVKPLTPVPLVSKPLNKNIIAQPIQKTITNTVTMREVVMIPMQTTITSAFTKPPVTYTITQQPIIVTKTLPPITINSPAKTIIKEAQPIIFTKTLPPSIIRMPNATLTFTDHQTTYVTQWLPAITKTVPATTVYTTISSSPEIINKTVSVNNPVYVTVTRVVTQLVNNIPSTITEAIKWPSEYNIPATVYHYINPNIPYNDNSSDGNKVNVNLGNNENTNSNITSPDLNTNSNISATKCVIDSNNQCINLPQKPCIDKICQIDQKTNFVNNQDNKTNLNNKNNQDNKNNTLTNNNALPIKNNTLTNNDHNNINNTLAMKNIQNINNCNLKNMTNCGFKTHNLLSQYNDQSKPTNNKIISLPKNELLEKIVSLLSSVLHNNTKSNLNNESNTKSIKENSPNAKDENLNKLASPDNTKKLDSPVPSAPPTLLDNDDIEVMYLSDILNSRRQ